MCVLRVEVSWARFGVGFLSSLYVCVFDFDSPYALFAVWAQGGPAVLV